MFGKGCQLRKNRVVLQESRTIFFNNSKGKVDVDDFTFGMWKSELQKELSSFWESMKR